MRSLGEEGSGNRWSGNQKTARFVTLLATTRFEPPEPPWGLFSEPDLRYSDAARMAVYDSAPKFHLRCHQDFLSQASFSRRNEYPIGVVGPEAVRLGTERVPPCTVDAHLEPAVVTADGFGSHVLAANRR